jgi:HEAT repeat protein
VERQARGGRAARLAAVFQAWRPASIATATALVAVGFGIGHLVASRSSEMTALRRELQSTRSMMALSLLQQRSPVDRLRGVGWSVRVETPDPEIVDALFETLEHDTNVDVRLAAVDALAGLRDADVVRTRLLESLRRQPSPLVQIAIIDALVRLREAEAQPALRSLADDAGANRTVRERARRAIQQLTL